jgi:hypothetical protein
VKEFHAKDFYPAARRKHGEPYRNWSEPKCSRFLSALLGVINSHHVIPVCCAVEIAGWNALSHDERQFLSGGLMKTRVALDFHSKAATFTSRAFASTGAPKRPILAVLQRFIGECVLLAKEDTVVDFTLDRQNSLEARTRETFAEQFKSGVLPAAIEAKVGTIAFGDSHEYEPLQAADLYAYVWNRYLRGRIDAPLLQQTVDAIARKRHHMTVYSEEHLRGIVTHSETDAIQKARDRMTSFFGVPFNP